MTAPHDRQLRRQHRGPGVGRAAGGRRRRARALAARTRTGARPATSRAGWQRAEVPVLDEVDTRRLTRHLRSVGVMRGVIGRGDAPDRRGAAPRSRRARPWRDSTSRSRVTTREPYSWGNPRRARHIVAYDFGIKRNILRLFDEHDCRVTVVPADDAGEPKCSSAQPDGVFLSQRPGRSRRRSTYAPDDDPRDRGRGRSRSSASASATSCSGSTFGGRHGEDAVRPSRRKSSGEGAVDRARADHVAEPRLRGRAATSRACRARRSSR